MPLLSILICLLLAASLHAQSPSSAGMNILQAEDEVDANFRNLMKDGGLPAIRLHYSLGVYERVASFLYTYSTPQNADSNLGYRGLEPASFSKPSESIYKRPVGHWGGNLKNAMRDNPEAASIMTFYQGRAALASVLLIAGVVSGAATLGGVMADRPFFAQDATGHTIAGTGVTVLFITSSLIPRLFNRGRMQQAVSKYNR